MNEGFKVAIVAMLFVFTTNIYASKNNSIDPSVIPYKELLSRNSEALSKLSLGMTKAEVIAIMGNFTAKTRNGMVPNPFRTEAFMRGDDLYEKLLYVTTAHHAWGAVNDSQTTPIVLKNGKVIGWGRDAVDAISSK